MKNTNKKIVWISLVAIVLVVIGILASSGDQDNSVKIGALMPLTGGLASYGQPAQQMADIAVADINAAGGINGKKLELVYEDHKCDPKTMVSAYDILVSQNVHVFNSVACSGTLAAVAPNLVSDNTVLLGTVTSGNALTAVSPNFFRNWATDGQEAKLLSDQVIKKGYKNVAVIYEQTDYAKGLETAMENDLKGTDVKITSESFASADTDVRTQLTKLQSIKPDVVFVSVQTVTTGEMVLTEMENLNFKPTMLINDNILKSSALLTKHASLLEGAVGGDYVISDSPALDKALAEYKTKYGTDCPQTNICAAEYDSIQLLANAIKTNGNSAKGVKEYLSGTTYTGVSGDISFDSSNNRNNAQYSLFTVKSGKASLLAD